MELVGSSRLTSPISIIFFVIFVSSSLLLISASNTGGGCGGGGGCSTIIPLKEDGSSHPIHIYQLLRQCPPPPPHHHLHISSSSPLQMDGESFERVLSSMSNNVHTAVLFYDDECPFSASIRSKFDALSSMFPYISHIAVEESSVMPSLFSRFGIHSLPALFIMNQTAQIRYHGPKDLHSLILFYQRMTGLNPVEYHTYHHNDQIVLKTWYKLSWKEILLKESFLVFAILFLVVRVSIYLYPWILSRLVALCFLCKRQFDFGIFGESRQLLERVLHLVDVKRVWRKLKLCQTRSFQRSARSAHVWASSLASVSLGETPPARAES